MPYVDIGYLLLWGVLRAAFSVWTWLGVFVLGMYSYTVPWVPFWYSELMVLSSVCVWSLLLFAAVMHVIDFLGDT